MVMATGKCVPGDNYAIGGYVIDEIHSVYVIVVGAGKCVSINDRSGNTHC